MTRCNLARASVCQALLDLEANGLIEVSRNQGLGNHYKLRQTGLPAGPVPTGLPARPPSLPARPPPVQQVDPNRNKPEGNRKGEGPQKFSATERISLERELRDDVLPRLEKLDGTLYDEKGRETRRALRERRDKIKAALRIDL